MNRFTVLALVAIAVTLNAAAADFHAGFAKRDITPQKPVPMWGYGDRHDALSTGVMDPLYAKAVVIEVGETSLAIVGLDIGRGPTAAMMERIRPAVQEQAGVDDVMISGSHSHHSPVIELLDAPEQGGERFPDAVQYAKDFERLVIEAIVEAAGETEPAQIGWGSADIDMNRNRQAQTEPKPRDTELTVIRLDDESGDPIALFVNYTAHPTMLPGEDLRFSAEYPGQMAKVVESELDTNCVFLQGASGDMSVRTTEETQGIEKFGQALAAEVLKVNESIQTAAPETPSVQVKTDVFEFETRRPLDNPAVMGILKAAFFPELVEAFREELKGDVMRPVLTTALINKELAIVGGSGEFFCNNANQLKARSRVKTIFQGYCNGHHMYFPTIEATHEGGYGADASVSWVPLGAGEEMMNQALINIYTMLGEK
jgi:neutral ceramidase